MEGNETHGLINGYLEELADTLFADYIGQADNSWHKGTLEELVEVKYGKDHKKLADGPYPVYGSGGFMRSAERFLFSGESVLIPRKGSLNNVMYVDEEFWTVDTMFFTMPRMPGAAKYAYQYVKRLDLASMNSGSAVPSMTTSILNALRLPIPPKESLAIFDDKLQPLYNVIRASNIENKVLTALRDTLLPKLMSGEIDVSKVDLTQLNSHLSKCSSGSCCILPVMAALSATKWRISTKLSMMRTLASIAVPLCNTADSIEASCSVNIRGI